MNQSTNHDNPTKSYWRQFIIDSCSLISLICYINSPTRQLTTTMTTLNIVTINVARTRDLHRSIKEAEKLEPDILERKTLLAKANKLLETSASAIMLYDSIGILIYNEDLKVLENTIDDRFIKLILIILIQVLKLSISRQKECQKLILYCVYASAKLLARNVFYEHDILGIQNLPTDDHIAIIITGDFNDYHNPHLDRHPSTAEGPTNRYWRSKFILLLNATRIVDAFRTLHPIEKEYIHMTIRNDSTISATRLDAILVSRNIVPFLTSMNHYDWRMERGREHQSRPGCTISLFGLARLPLTGEHGRNRKIWHIL